MKEIGKATGLILCYDVVYILTVVHIIYINVLQKGRIMDSNNYNYNSTVETRCPGKEISGLVLGINSIFWSAFGLIFCWYAALGITYGVIGIVCGIVALVLHKKVMEQATVITKKIKVAKTLGTIGIIVGAVLIVLSIILLIVFITLGVGMGALGSMYEMILL